jgi:hypothetical protein
VVIDEAAQAELFEKNKSKLFKPPPSTKQFVLPIPFDPCEPVNKKTPEPFVRDVAKTNNYLIVNYTQQERLLLHEFTLAQAEKNGFKLGKENDQNFFKYGSGEENNSTHGKRNGKIKLH